MVTTGAGRVVAPGPPAFGLHTLGWRAFQDLCAAVLRTVWGQEAHAFADSNDAGRDGAFYGTWHNPPHGTAHEDRIDGPFVLQCKHTRRAGSTLSESDLEEEFAKVPLIQRGLCRSYVLMTNARVTGNAEEKILSRLRRAGVEHPFLLDGQWVCDTIAKYRELRMFVLRVYGLGDLSQILDERAYAQASVLIAAARDQAAAFVITQPYLKAAEALREHGFVLLLGEPAVGKSLIALMLALAALDNWGCATIRARTASEDEAAWRRTWMKASEAARRGRSSARRQRARAALGGSARTSAQGRPAPPKLLPGEPDPWAAATSAQYIRQLRALRAWTGQTGLPKHLRFMPTSTFYSTLNPKRTRLPPLNMVQTIVEACGANVSEWTAAWRVIRMREFEEENPPLAGVSAGESLPGLRCCSA